MKKNVRILYPAGALAVGIEAKAGDVKDADADIAATLIAAGYAEEVAVEKVTAAPGEKRKLKESRR